MTTNMMVDAAVDEIKKNLVLFCQEHAEGPLTGASAEAVALGIQKALAGAGKAAFRTFLEAKDDQPDIVVFGGERYRFKGCTKREFMTLWGKMEIERRLYENKADTKCHWPLDAAWGMADEYLTVELREAVAFACAHATPEETAAMLGKVLPECAHPTQMKKAIEKIAACVRPQREAVDARIRERESAPEATRVLTASMDGVNVLLNEPGAKRGRPAERPTGEDADKERTTAYKNAMVGSLSFYGEVPEGEKCPERLESRYVSQMPEDGAPAFKARFEAELQAARAQCAPGAVKQMLCDGARPLWKYIDGNPLYDDFEKMVDFHHTTEHLSLAAEALFGKGSGEAENWYAKWHAKLLGDERGAQGVLDSMDYYAKVRKLSRAQRAGLATQRTFFARNQHRMAYADSRARGLPIGSGPVEAACKSLVKTRMCRSGMRWSREGGQRILDLRTYAKSGRWEDFWKQYKELKFAA